MGFRVHDLNSPVFWKMLMRVRLCSVCEHRVLVGEWQGDHLFNVTGIANITHSKASKVTHSDIVFYSYT